MMKSVISYICESIHFGYILKIFILFLLPINFATAQADIFPVTHEFNRMKSDFMGIVEIQSSEVIRYKEYNCGVRYTATIITALKTQNNTPTTFSFRSPWNIVTGHSYLVYLIKKETPYAVIPIDEDFFQRETLKRSECYSYFNLDYPLHFTEVSGRAIEVQKGMVDFGKNEFIELLEFPKETSYLPQKLNKLDTNQFKNQLEPNKFDYVRLSDFIEYDQSLAN